MAVLFERYPGLSVELVVRDSLRHRRDIEDAYLADRCIRNHRANAISSRPALPGVLSGTAPVRQPTGQSSCIVHETGQDSAVGNSAGRRTGRSYRLGVFRANNSGVVHRAALAGYGIAFLWEQYVADDIRAGRLYPLLPDYPSERSHAYVIYPSRRPGATHAGSDRFLG
jgi:DNA-binding transcriptional LysR family regulator